MGLNLEVCGECGALLPPAAEAICVQSVAANTEPTPAVSDILSSVATDPAVVCGTETCSSFLDSLERRLIEGRELQDSGTTVFRISVEVPGTVDVDAVIDSIILAEADLNDALASIGATFVGVSLDGDPTDSPFASPTESESSSTKSSKSSKKSIKSSKSSKSSKNNKSGKSTKSSKSGKSTKSSKSSSSSSSSSSASVVEASV